MHSFCHYEQSIKQLFHNKILQLPVEGVTLMWLTKLKGLQLLIEEAELFYPTIKGVVNREVATLQGSAAYTWAMLDTLEKMRIAMHTIEGNMRDAENQCGFPLSRLSSLIRQTVN